MRYHKDTYRQLKIASQKNGNNIDALVFHANEMRTYWKEIRITGGIPAQDRFLVFLNRWTSNFGQSWVLPLLWLLIFNGLYYVLTIRPEFSLCISDWGNGFLEMITFINPLKSMGAQLTAKENGKLFLLTILNAYLIYHFIKATRKFGKV